LNKIAIAIAYKHFFLGTDEYFESGGRGHNIYFIYKYRGEQRNFFIVITKVWGKPPPV
jgi:hypothetical protein